MCDGGAPLGSVLLLICPEKSEIKGKKRMSCLQWLRTWASQCWVVASRGLGRQPCLWIWEQLFTISLSRNSCLIWLENSLPPSHSFFIQWCQQLGFGDTNDVCALISRDCVGATDGQHLGCVCATPKPTISSAHSLGWAGQLVDWLNWNILHCCLSVGSRTEKYLMESI